MGLKDRVGYWFGQLNRRRAKRELSEEMRLHLEMEVEANLEAGMDPEEARRAAARRFGNPELRKEECYDASGMARLDGWLRDFSYAFRMLGKRPLFTFLTAGILALGIGPATAVFSVFHGVLLAPLPFREPSRLVTISGANDSHGWEGFPIPQGILEAFQGGSRTLPDIAAYETGSFTWLGGPEPLRVRGAEVTGNFFDVLGLEPIVGRFLQSGREDEAVISHSLWQRNFGGDASVLGQTIRLDGKVRSIVGVTPPHLSYPEPGIEFWLPLRLESGADLWGRWSLRALARLAPEATLESARQETAALTAGVADRLPFGGVWRFPLALVEDDLLGEVRVGLWILMGSVGLALLIASLNVASICLARARDRGAELSMRSILGAGRWVLTRQLLIEHLMLALLGAGAGVALAFGLLRVILLLTPPDLPRLDEVALDGPVLLFALGVTLLSGLLAASLPALSFRRLQSRPGLFTGSRQPIESGGGPRSRRTLVAAQVAAVTILLVVAGLMARSFLRVAGVDSGLRAENLLAVSVELSRDRYPKAPQWSGFFQNLLQEASQIPGVRSVGLTTGLPTRGVQAIDESFRTEDRAEPVPIETAVDAVSPEYFQAAGTSVRGRSFLETDRADSPLVAIINQRLAEAAFGDRDPLGKRILASDDENWLTVVGVSQNVKQYGLDRETPLQMFRPFTQLPSSKAHLLLAVDGQTRGVPALVKQVIHRIDPEQPVRSVDWMEDLVSLSIAPRRFPATLLGALSILSLLLALAGVYGMLAQMVSLRTHEMGVRLAVGARQRDLLKLVLLPALKLTLLGLAAGLLGAVMVTRSLESQLFEIGPLDAASFTVVALLVPLTSLLAGYLPARRAAKTDPVRALRQE